MKGILKFWNVERGFGWVTNPDGRNRFLHIRNWLGLGVPVVGREVEYEIGPGRGYQEQAINAHYSDTTVGAGVDALKAGA